MFHSFVCTSLHCVRVWGLSVVLLLRGRKICPPPHYNHYYTQDISSYYPPAPRIVCYTEVIMSQVRECYGMTALQQLTATFLQQFCLFLSSYPKQIHTHITCIKNPFLQNVLLPSCHFPLQSAHCLAIALILGLFVSVCFYKDGAGAVYL